MKREQPGNSHDPWTDRLSDYLDGELPAAERQQLEAHLQGCPGCASLLEELRGVILQAAAGARDSEPASDLWAGIRSRLQPRQEFSPDPNFARDRFVIRNRNWRNWRRDWISGWRLVPALAAAAVVVLAVASVLWLRGGGTAGPGEAGRGEQTVASQPSTPAPSLPRALEASREYYDTVAELRRTVEQRLTHDPRVVEILDDNLAAIDAAIAGYRDALATDPGNQALAQRLERAREQKIEVLRQTAALAEAAN